MNNRFPSSVVRIANLDTQSPFGVVLVISYHFMASVPGNKGGGSWWLI